MGTLCSLNWRTDEMPCFKYSSQLEKKTLLFFQFIPRPAWSLKSFRSLLMFLVISIETFTKIIRSSVKCKWETAMLPLMNRVGMRPLVSHSSKTTEKCSITVQKRQGGGGQPCLRPFLLLKKPLDFPFTKTEEGEKQSRENFVLIAWLCWMKHRPGVGCPHHWRSPDSDLSRTKIKLKKLNFVAVWLYP